MGMTRAKTGERARKDVGQDTSDLNAPSSWRRPSRKGSQRKQRSSSGKLTKAQQSKRRDSEKAEPFSNESKSSMPTTTNREPIDEKNGLATASEPLPDQLTSPPADRGDIPSYYFQNPLSQSSLQPERFTAITSPPTLRSKSVVNDSVLARQKSSKRKAEDHAREQEVKAMSSAIPISKRPAANNTGLLARENKKALNGLNRNFERPTSDVSLPIPESMHSSMSGVSDGHNYKISAFDVLSPRPTIRYSENPRSTSTSHFVPSRSSTRKDKGPMLPEETPKSNVRINDLADKLDASGLRELMERDRRRTEKKRRSDREKMQRRLERKAEKQQDDLRKDERNPDPLLTNDLDEDAIGRDAIGLGIGETATAPHKESPLLDTKREDATDSPSSWLQDPSKENLPPEDPFQDPAAEAGVTHLEDPTPLDEPDDPIIETAKAVRLSQASMSPPTSPMRLSHGPSNLLQLADLASRSTPDIPEQLEPERRDSDTSARLTGSWTSFFKRGGTRGKRDSADRGRASPSDFSNTSRESFVRQGPPPTFIRNVRARSGTPVRTQSKFREDLPELPISPPDSRVQSPEVTGQSSSPLPDRDSVAPRSNRPLSEIHPAFRDEVALSRHQSLTAPSLEGPSGTLVSQSLASVDSEGSWLSGRPVKRASQPSGNPLRESGSSLQQRMQEYGESEEVLLNRDNTYGYSSRLTPGPEERTPQAQPIQARHFVGTSEVIEDSDDEALPHHPQPAEPQEEGTWHGAVGRQPTIVRHAPRAKSREGLLNEFDAGDESPESSPADSPLTHSLGYPAAGPDNPFIHRATSVDLGKSHVRHISAGSARLLNLPPRGSGDLKRMSTGSGERSPLSMPSPDLARETQPSDVD